EVRGLGNLPFLRTPTLDLADFETFGSSVDDSLPPAGTLQSARRRFQWTVLPKRIGSLEIQPPAFVWFDPQAGVYREAELPSYEVVVGAASPANASSNEGLPPVFAHHPLDPGARPAQPWAWAIAGVT